jgi:hypothetical protein
MGDRCSQGAHLDDSYEPMFHEHTLGIAMLPCYGLALGTERNCVTRLHVSTFHHARTLLKIWGRHGYNAPP